MEEKIKNKTKQQHTYKHIGNKAKQITNNIDTYTITNDHVFKRYLAIAK